MSLICTMANIHGDPQSNTMAPVYKFASVLGKHIGDLARENRIPKTKLTLLGNFDMCIIVTNDKAFIVLPKGSTSGIPNHYLIEWLDKTIDIDTARAIVQRDIGFEDTIGISIERSIFLLSDAEQDKTAFSYAEEYIQMEKSEIERKENMVKINPIFRGRDFIIDNKLIFILSPFGTPFDDIYIDHIQPIVQSIEGMKCVRADNIYSNNAIMEDIWESINKAGIIIADLTNKNPNVFYEVGIAHTIGKNVVLLTQNINDVPFDLRHLRCIVYEYTPKGIKLLEETLKNTIIQLGSK